MSAFGFFHFLTAKQLYMGELKTNQNIISDVSHDLINQFIIFAL